ncbi:protein FAM117A isoform X2 [Notolabrus celidotus]|uniref:protein FAM117A isoform X2 n=1 Tax=Notolabrus celidotus TaxID=1203425 RepID=UPI00148FA43F|nr:protein FAM117A isoform X2 [Notolabrus celidotus]
MLGRSGGAPRGCNNPSLLPLRATVPYQLQRGSALLCREVKTDKTSARPPKPTIRRTLSLDAIVGPYLQGQWPKEAETTAVSCVNDKATQTPSSWADETRGRRSSVGHKRSASWGSAEHLREVAKLRHQLQKRSRHAPPPAGCDLTRHHPLPGGHGAGISQTVPLIPLNRLASRLRRSVEGLNLELEEVFVSEKPSDQHEILDIPDGHRAPNPAQRCSSGSQSEPSPGPLDPSLLSPSHSPCPLDPSLLSPSNSPCPLNPSLLSPSQSPCPIGEPEPAHCGPLRLSPSMSLPLFALDPPLMQPCSSSSCATKTCSFQRQPPEGCERIRVCEEAISAACQDEPLLQPSCPDPNKVNFTPHGGSAFCPVSLLKPLLPSMDLLFRGLSVSPVTGCPGQASPTRHLGMQ